MRNGKGAKKKSAAPAKAKARTTKAKAKAKPAKAAPPRKAPAAKPAARAKQAAPPARAAKAKPAAAKRAAPAEAAPPPAPAPAAAKPAGRSSKPTIHPPPAEVAPAPEEKQYKLRADQLEPIAEGHGACIASDKITVDGNPVGFMYREAAIHEVDSGWRFLSGLESDAYMQNASNHAFYDCNTIANYDRSIVPYLDSPVGSVFEKPPGTAEFEAVTDWTPE